ncbi:MAG TPA: hypothetical protein DCX79_14790 [Planctomycetaceae bacterium]|nr:hypothetical protein [Planctomycetaceae bacterium]
MRATEVTPDEWQEDDTVRILSFGGSPPGPKPRWRTGAGSSSERPGPLFFTMFLRRLHSNGKKLESSVRIAVQLGESAAGLSSLSSAEALQSVSGRICLRLGTSAAGTAAATENADMAAGSVPPLPYQ